MKKMLLPLAFFISVFSSTILVTAIIKVVTGTSYKFSDARSSSGVKNNAQAYTIKLIPIDEGSYGYEIYSNNKLLIRQMNIPRQSGNRGFRRKSDARKVAKLVVEKLSKGIMPPTVERSEMEKLKVQI